MGRASPRHRSQSRVINVTCEVLLNRGRDLMVAQRFFLTQHHQDRRFHRHQQLATPGFNVHDDVILVEEARLWCSYSDTEESLYWPLR